MLSWKWTIKSDKSGQRSSTTPDLQPTKICKWTGRYLSFTGGKWSEDEATRESDLLTLLRSLQVFISWAHKSYHIHLFTLDLSFIDDFSADTYTETVWGLPLSPGPLRWGMSCVVAVGCWVQLTCSKTLACMMITHEHSMCVRDSSSYAKTVWSPAREVATWRVKFGLPILRKSCKSYSLLLCVI